MRRWRFLTWSTVGALGLAVSCGGKTTVPPPVRYDVEGTWFSSSGPSDGGVCFGNGLAFKQVTSNSWLVTRNATQVTAIDAGGCSLKLREASDGVLIGDGESCDLAKDGSLAQFGLKERRYARFRLDPKQGYFGAVTVERQEPNPRDRSLFCGFFEARIKAQK